MGRSRRVRFGAVLAVIAGLSAALSVSACTSPRGTGTQSKGGASSAARETTPITQLEKVQVRQYQGKRLSSIGDLPENSIEGTQFVDPNRYRLRITGKVSKPQTLTYGDVLVLPRYKKVVQLDCVEGWSVEILWEGVLLKDLLTKAGYDPTAKIVIFRAYDGYSSSLPLEYIVSRKILFADSMNGVTLPPVRGFPFQVIAEDRWGYKWVKWVTEIEVSNDESFRGYWEKRGFPNNATLPTGK